VDALVAARQYEGRQWLASDYLSVEPVEGAPGRLRITVRETWEDYLVIYTGENPFSWWDVDAGDGDEPIAARRGPYTVDVVYELEPEPNECEPGQYFCVRWRVVGVTELTPSPDWGD
jgi:hypothetical protein